MASGAFFRLYSKIDRPSKKDRQFLPRACIPVSYTHLDVYKRQVHAAAPEREGGRVSYPGERTVATRGEHLANGVEVDESVWEEVCRLAQ